MAKSKKQTKPADSTGSPETSKPLLQARVTDELLEKIRYRSKPERHAIGEVMNRVLGAWGHPHHHAGIGIRRLTRTIYECWIGRDERLAFVFIATTPALVFFFLGNHDEMQKLLRSSK